MAEEAVHIHPPGGGARQRDEQFSDEAGHFLGIFGSRSASQRLLAESQYPPPRLTW